MAAVGDLHCRVNTGRQIRELLDGVDGEADALVLAGDLTDGGSPAEMEVLLAELTRLSFPILAVLGNHDHEAGHPELLSRQLEQAGIYLLDGTAYEMGGVGFVGTKGFCGGFDEVIVQPFGEEALKAFIRASIDEAVRLENALTKLDCPRRVAVLHYAPVTGTLQGERPELYPFLGSSRLANALDRHGVDLIVHGHAHHGSPAARTRAGIPVYNVSRFVGDPRHSRPVRMFEV